MAIEAVETRIHNKNKILFAKSDPQLEKLATRLEQTSKRVAILWALEQATRIVMELDFKYPDNDLFDQSLNLASMWMQGQIKMPQAKKAILALHQLATSFESSPDTYLDGLKIRALAHGLATIHSQRHAIGLPLYYLSALVMRNRDCYDLAVETRIAQYHDSLEYYQSHLDQCQVTWAKFLKNQ